MNKERKQKPLHGGHRQRLKERYLNEGLDSFEPHQVLELLLFYALPYKDTNELAHRLIAHFGSLHGVLDAAYEELLQVPGVGANTACLLTMLPDLFRSYQLDRYQPRQQFPDTAALGSYVCDLFLGCDYEVFYLICLDMQNRLIKASMINRGTIDEVFVYPRIVAETALRHKAKRVVLAHNHPGGTLRPTSADLKLTRHIDALLRDINITVVDHIIAVGMQYFSFSEKNLLGG
ncbi:MAG: DNA repair protein RadC [Bacillota bacterium]|nr:DNA repair protein RadC [Bacillota bacterium]